MDKLLCQGKILRIPIVLKNVCRNKSIALAVFLREKVYCGDNKFYYKELGFKVLEVPAEKKHLIDNDEKGDSKKCTTCKDLKVEGICFVLPVDLCDAQDVEIHVLANYLSFDYDPLDCKK